MINTGEELQDQDLDQLWEDYIHREKLHFSLSFYSRDRLIGDTLRGISLSCHMSVAWYSCAKSGNEERAAVPQGPPGHIVGPSGPGYLAFRKDKSEEG